MRLCTRCCVKACATAGSPPAAAMATQLSGMRSAMLPKADTASVCIAAWFGCSSIAWMIATWPPADTIASLHWSLPEMLAKKKHACFAT
eukprot:4184365-Pleurochrysis_carterae.AAC.1